MLLLYDVILTCTSSEYSNVKADSCPGTNIRFHSLLPQIRNVAHVALYCCHTSHSLYVTERRCTCILHSSLLSSFPHDVPVLMQSFVCVFSGIFAYLNYNSSHTRQEIIDILITGLKRLEYRGYDSAGMMNLVFLLGFSMKFVVCNMC